MRSLGEKVKFFGAAIRPGILWTHGETGVFNGRRIGLEDLDPHLTVLIGENAAGKTCVLDALAMGLRPLVDRIRRRGGGGVCFRALC